MTRSKTFDYAGKTLAIFSLLGNIPVTNEMNRASGHLRAHIG